jgi:hypothetical protein
MCDRNIDFQTVHSRAVSTADKQSKLAKRSLVRRCSRAIALPFSSRPSCSESFFVILLPVLLPLIFSSLPPSPELSRCWQILRTSGTELQKGGWRAVLTIGLMSPLALMGIWNKNDCSGKIGVDLLGGRWLGADSQISLNGSRTRQRKDCGYLRRVSWNVGQFSERNAISESRVDFTSF